MGERERGACAEPRLFPAGRTRVVVGGGPDSREVFRRPGNGVARARPTDLRFASFFWNSRSPTFVSLSLLPSLLPLRDAAPPRPFFPCVAWRPLSTLGLIGKEEKEEARRPVAPLMPQPRRPAAGIPKSCMDGHGDSGPFLRHRRLRHQG